MKKWIIILLCVYINAQAQILIEYLSDVPENFKKEYFKKPREYNPLHVGDVWQYYFSDYTYPFYSTTKVVKDSIIIGKKYFKKINYQVSSDPQSLNKISWERNDTVSGVSFMLDFQDVDEDGDSLDELPLDSLELPRWSRYTTYKYSFNNPFFWSGAKTTFIYDSIWVVIAGDTVISRITEITDLFWSEEIADKFGIYNNNSESPIRWLTGAIINGKQYGTIVNVEKASMNLPSEIKLENNYPNPFNPVTTIDYTIPVNGMVTIKVFDTLGREVVTLINEQKNSGRYSVKFNAVDLPSGIYYYTLMTDSKRTTKSMVLLK
ncbi:MAG: T9SS type A sorting domain-containing protein [Chlorobi bacterium]|nr:T9SS type A sorting domain-containing protein [Chlorobiota bacterium]